MDQKNKILLVDGMALLFRGYFATAFTGNFMRNSQGVPTNGVFQFLRYFTDAIGTFKPSHVICCWDMGSKTFRTEIYPEYKANREAPPEELIPQFDLTKEAVAAYDVPNIGLINYEADDCIGTLAKHFQEENEVFILTGDHDMLQLVEQNISVAIMKKGIGNYEVFHVENFFEKRGIFPEQIIDMKGLTGDSADNYPGVKGIGDKTAIKLLTEHKTIENLLENLPSLTKGLQKKLTENMDVLHLSRELATIKLDVPVSCELHTATWAYHNDKVIDFLNRLEIKQAEIFLI